MSHIGHLNVERLWAHLTRVTRHTMQDTGRSRDRTTSPRWAMLQQASADHCALVTLPPTPSEDAADVEAVFAAVRAAICAGASTAVIQEAISRGFAAGFKREETLARRRNKLSAANRRHEDAELEKELRKPAVDFANRIIRHGSE